MFDRQGKIEVLKVTDTYCCKEEIGEKMASTWIPTTVIGCAILVLAVYMLVTKNLTILIGMQIMQIKTNHRDVAIKSGQILIAIAIFTLLLPLMEKLNIIVVILDLIFILALAISLFIYIYKQKKG